MHASTILVYEWLGVLVSPMQSALIPGTDDRWFSCLHHCSLPKRIGTQPASSLRARPGFNIPVDESAPEPTFFSSRVFVSPMQSALTPGQSTDRWLSCLDYWSPTAKYG